MFAPLAVTTALALAACGRIGFAPVAGDDGDAGTSDAPQFAACTERVAMTVPESAIVTGTVDEGPSGASGTCGSATKTEDLYQLDVTVPGSRIQLAADDGGPPATVALYVWTDCADPASELACDLESGSSTRPLITEPVPPGRYFVFVDGREGEPDGAYRALMRVLLPKGAACDPQSGREVCDGGLTCSGGTCQASTCAGAIALGAAPVNTLADTDSAENLHAGTCGAGHDGGTRAPERIYTFELTAPASDVIVSTDDAATTYDTLVYVRASCNGPDLACNDDIDASNTSSELSTGQLAAGTYFVFVDGFAASGQATLTIALVP